MNTSFGKFLEKDIFKRIFLIAVLVSIVFGAVLNGSAVRSLFRHVGIAYLIGILYAIMGISVFTQAKILEKWKNKLFETILGFYSCFFIYNLMFLFFWWIFAGIFSVSNPKRSVGVLCVDIVTAVLVLAGYLNAKQVTYTSYSVHLGLQENPQRIAMLSDIHLGVFVREKHISRIVEKVNRLNADLVVICGDIIDVNHHILEDDKALAKISSIFRKINAKNGVFAVLGNHDPNIENEKFSQFLRESGICILHNQAVLFPDFNLIGRTDASNNERSPLKPLADSVTASLPTIVLDHNPSGIPEAVQCGVDLVLSGHTHKGQFIPVTFFTKLANGKHYFYGHEQFGKTHAIISSGAGFFQLPIRIGTSNEIVDIYVE